MQVKKETKGMITLTLAISVGMIIVGGITTFYTVKGNTDKEIGLTNERVSVVETQVSSILKSQERMEENIKTISNFLINSEI